MRSRLLHVGIVFILVVCLVCPLVELFDSWDHTLQTGNDSEYTLVLLALCVGAVFALARLIVTLSACLSEASVDSTSSFINGSLTFPVPLLRFSPASGSPPSNLRI